jgi:hypothetical protein
MTASNLLATAQVSHSIEYSSGTGPATRQFRTGRRRVSATLRSRNHGMTGRGVPPVTAATS